MLKKKSWEIQDGFKYKPPFWLAFIYTFTLTIIIAGILQKEIMSIFVGVISGIGGGIGTWVDYTIKKKNLKYQSTIK